MGEYVGYCARILRSDTWEKSDETCKKSVEGNYETVAPDGNILDTLVILFVNLFHLKKHTFLM